MDQKDYSHVVLVLNAQPWGSTAGPEFSWSRQALICIKIGFSKGHVENYKLLHTGRDHFTTYRNPHGLLQFWESGFLLFIRKKLLSKFGSLWIHRHAAVYGCGGSNTPSLSIMVNKTLHTHRDKNQYGKHSYSVEYTHTHTHTTSHSQQLLASIPYRKCMYSYLTHMMSAYAVSHNYWIRFM